MKKRAAVLIATALVSLGRSASAAPVAQLTFVSQPGDWLGQGQTFDSLYDFQVFGNYAQVDETTAGGQPDLVFFQLWPKTIVQYSENPIANLWFGTDQLDLSLTPGFYANADRA